LHEALIALVREKDYDEIAIQELLDRANVGRSTFYTHYRDKDDLLVSGIHDMLRSVSSAKPSATASWRERLTWFSLPILEHHDRHRRSGELATGGHARTVLHERPGIVINRILRDEVGRYPDGRRRTRVPPELLIPYISSTFVLVLNWWLETRSDLRPAQVHELFCSLVSSALAA
jgi:AcrR family transcriptional regulator